MMSGLREYGGYLSLERVTIGSHPWENYYSFQSARAALECLLDSLKNLEYLYVPYYICDTVLRVIQKKNIELRFYHIDEDLLPIIPCDLKANDILYIVNFFGVIDDKIAKFISSDADLRVILDCSQSLFTTIKSDNILGTIYSPRKFLGVPDGGFLHTLEIVHYPDLYDNLSIRRMSHLVNRLSHPASFGYDDFVHAEETFMNCDPKRMSHLTDMLMRTIDYSSIRKIRRTNCNVYSTHLTKYMLNEISPEAVPLCLPVFPKNNKLKTKLITERIYLPTYWKEVKERVSQNSLEWKLVEQLCALPCDQRYSTEDIQNISNIVLENL